MTNNVNPISIPAQRYFTRDELCEIVGISRQEFAAWQRDYGLIGYGGERYNRLDVLKVLQMKDTFAPYVDAFTHNLADENGEPAADSLQVKHDLSDLLGKIENVIALSDIES